jgi:3-oxoacid CoA-transferase subunit B
LNAKERLLKRAAQDIRGGMIVNLGIGLPTQVTRYLAADLPVCLHSENGIAGVGPQVPNDEADRNLIDAGGAYVSPIDGTSYFDSAVSFAIVRSGRLDLTLLGAFQVAANGDLANWMIPGFFTPGAGGAIELAQKARKVAVISMHTDKKGRPKILERCTLPLTAQTVLIEFIQTWLWSMSPRTVWSWLNLQKASIFRTSSMRPTPKFPSLTGLSQRSRADGYYGYKAENRYP